MPLTLHRRVWVLAERLYIHCHDASNFLSYLQQYGIDYPGEAYIGLSEGVDGDQSYRGFGSVKPLYTFMSEDDYRFADFMTTQPSYKYLKVLTPIVFDDCAIATQDNDWNYYGEDIDKWRPELVDLLRIADVTLDETARKLEYHEEEPEISGIDFLPNAFNDFFLDYMRKEINEAYKANLYLSVMVLSRKLLESTIVRFFEVVFPKTQAGKHVAENHDLWYDRERGRYQDFEVLLGNLKANASKFDEDRRPIGTLVELVRPFKNETNRYVHDDHLIADEASIRQWKIPTLVAIVHKIFKKYCNP